MKSTASTLLYNQLDLNRTSYLFIDVVKGCCQHTIATGLASKRLTHQHETMPHYHHLKDLQDFLSKKLGDLKVHAPAVFLDSLQQDTVVSFWKLDSREEVRGDSLRWKVVGEQ